jgi:hypothetical protein
MAITLNSHRELQWVKEGRVFYATHGALTTAAAFETDLVRQTPDLMVRVPAGVVIVPIRVQVAAEATDTAVQQCLISTCNNDPGVTGRTAFTPVNVNTRYALTGSQVTCYITSTDNSGTAPAGVSDVYRSYVQPRIDNVGTGSAPFEQVVYSPLHGMGSPCILGSDSSIHAFLVYAGYAGTATGFILAAWAEFTYTEFYAA